MKNTLTVAMLRRRGMAAIEGGLRHGPIHIMKRGKPAAVVLSEADYRRLTDGSSDALPGLTATQWLLAQSSLELRSKQDIDEALDRERSW
jgi:PHD/YefM family antitoxin component YafN of YafNO toxin-antitoxin module